jgi:hypothetical protein
MHSFLRRFAAPIGALAVAATALLSVPGSSSAAPPAVPRSHRILIWGDVIGEHDYSDNPALAIVNRLRNQGWTVDDRTIKTRLPLPADFTPYGQVWHIDEDPEFSKGLAPDIVKRLIAYSKTGGGIFLASGGAAVVPDQNAINGIMQKKIKIVTRGDATPQFVNPWVVPGTLYTKPCLMPLWTVNTGGGAITGLSPDTNILVRSQGGTVRAAAYPSNTSRHHGPLVYIADGGAAGHFAFGGGMCLGENIALFLSGLSQLP